MGQYVPEDHTPQTQTQTVTQTKRKMWSDYMSEGYHSRRPPAIGTVDVKKVEDAAREKLKDRQGAFRFQLRASASTSGTMMHTTCAHARGIPR